VTKGKAGEEIRTLSLDVGGSGIKGMVLDLQGNPLNEKVRIRTPRPATPKAVLKTIAKVIARQPEFNRVSVGFPGVVEFGVVKTAPNLDGDWSDVPLAGEIERLTGKPCRAANDADVQGYGAIEGIGVEMVLTLGTGMGSAIFSNGHLVPNLELGHHPFADGKTYEDLVGDATRKAVGKTQWKRWVKQVINQILPIWNPRRLYLGGGNATKLRMKLPDGVVIIPNVTGILGGIRLWEDEDH
jgi:polyphosphate glucokinase